METLNNVIIPPNYFIDHVTKVYTNPLEALVREVVQNSKDAGASRLDFIIEDNKITFKDNGKGMNKSELVNGLLTLSGSIKGEGAVGGFGEAKLLIKICQESYETRTRDLLAYGSGLTYILQEGLEEFAGTMITIVPHKKLKFEKDNFIYIIKKYVEQCSFDMSVYINDKRIYQTELGSLIKELSWASIYSRKLDGYNSSYVKVYHNGLLMFSKWVEETDYQLSLDIKGKSTDVLVSSRDNLREDPFGRELDKLLVEIGKSQGRFGKLYNLTEVWRGRRSFIKTMRENISCEEMREQILSLIPNLSEITSRTEQIELLNSAVVSATIPDEVKEKMQELKKTIQADIENDFKVKIEKKGYDTIPAELDPNKMKKKYEVIAKLWKAALQEISSIYYGMPSNYCIGFLISDEAEAMFERDVDGEVCFYINPYIKEHQNAGSDVEVVHRIIVTACHEVAHTNCSWHGVGWQSEFEKLIVKFFARCNVSTVRKLAREISL